MYYFCLTHKNTMQGWGVPPHISYKHGRMAGKQIKLIQRERLMFSGSHHSPRHYDYFIDGELTVVCLGSGDPKYMTSTQIERLVAHAQEYWRTHKPETEGNKA